LVEMQGPAGVGRAEWGEIGVLAPRNDWLVDRAQGIRAAGLKSRCKCGGIATGDNPVYA